jgi:hypothetical protein
MQTTTTTCEVLLGLPHLLEDTGSTAIYKADLQFQHWTHTGFLACEQRTFSINGVRTILICLADYSP